MGGRGSSARPGVGVEASGVVGCTRLSGAQGWAGQPLALAAPSSALAPIVFPSTPNLPHLLGGGDSVGIPSALRSRLRTTPGAPASLLPSPAQGASFPVGLALCQVALGSWWVGGLSTEGSCSLAAQTQHSRCHLPHFPRPPRPGCRPPRGVGAGTRPGCPPTALHPPRTWVLGCRPEGWGARAGWARAERVSPG